MSSISLAFDRAYKLPRADRASQKPEDDAFLRSRCSLRVSGQNLKFECSDARRFQFVHILGLISIETLLVVICS